MKSRDTEIKTLTAQVKNLEDQVKALEAAGIQQSGQLSALRAKADEKDLEISRLTEEAETLQAQNNQLAAEKDALQARADRLEGKSIQRLARTNEEDVRLREQPDTGSRRLRELKLGQEVLVVKEVVNSKFESWAAVEVDGQKGFIMMQYLDLEDEE